MKNKYIEAINAYLKQKYNQIQPEWQLSIDLLADNIATYEKCKEVVDKVGIYDYETGKKNPLLSTMKETQGVILKQIQHFGLSPYAVSKIKSMAVDDEDEFLEGLTL